MLLGCLIDGLPYGYFQILRWVVCGVCSYRAYFAYAQEKNIWMWVLGCSAVLFNPLIPIHLDREVWVIIDVLMAACLIASLKIKKAEPEA